MVDPQTSRFWQASLQSELIDLEGLTACLEAIPLEKRAPDQLDRRLARQAVTAGLLTLWQAQQLLSGRSTGFRINRYVLLDLIGQGGMGRVYLAKDTRLNRRVAVKILSPERVNNPRATARFQREARVGAQLQHEHLVRIYDEGEANGKCYIVMEYIEGKNIGTMIAETGPLAPGLAARLARQVALGLQHAQQKGLIHRDVNPYNILVTKDGTAKLTDLGLAIDLADDVAVTRDGATVGTFDYVSPEQARHSHSVDTRSDIYSLGCTLYHMLAGRVPFPSPSLPEKLFGHQQVEPEPLTQFAPGVPEGLAEVVQRMMRKTPEERYADPLELAQALEPFVDVLEPGSGSHDEIAIVRASGTVKPPLSADTRISRHIEPAAPAPAPAAPPVETTSGSMPALDLGIDFGGGARPAAAAPPKPVEPVKPPKPVAPVPARETLGLPPGFGSSPEEEKPAEAPFDLGIMLNPGPATESKAPAPPKPATPAPAKAPAPSKPPAPTPPPAAGPAREDALPSGFNFNFGEEKPAGDALNLGLALDLGPAPAPALATPPSKPAPKNASPVPAATKTPPSPKPAPAPEAPLDFGFAPGGRSPAEEAPVDLGLGLNLDLAPSPAPAASAPPKPKPAKPVAPPPPEEPPLSFDFSGGLTGEPREEGPLNLGFGLDLGSAPASPPSKPAPKPPAPAPTAAPAPAATAKPKKPIWKERRLLIGAGAGSVLCLALGLAIVLGAFGGGSSKTTVAKGKGKAKVKPASSSHVAVDRSPVKPNRTNGKKTKAFEATIPEGEGFAVQAGDGSYTLEPDLKNAMQRAIGSKGRVVLNNKTPRKLTGGDAAITISGGLLTIAAAPGTQPVLEVEVKGGTPWLSTRTDTPLRMVGVTIVAQFTNPGPDLAPVVLAGGKVEFDRCAFRAAGAVPGSRVVAAEGIGLTATGCWFEGFDKPLDASAFGGTVITIRQCMMVRAKPDAQPIGWGVRVRNFPGGGRGPRQLVMDHCTIKGKGLIDLVDFASEYPLEVKITDCAGLGDAVLAWESRANTPLTPEALKWSGLGNVYDLHGKAWIVPKSDGTGDLPDAPTDLDSWNKRFTDRDAQAKAVGFATEAAALSNEPEPADFAIADSKAGADPNQVGPKGKPAKAR